MPNRTGRSGVTKRNHQLSEPSGTQSAIAGPERQVSLGEIAVVLGITVGMMVIGTVSQTVAESRAIAFTDEHLVGVVEYEILLTAILVPWLSTRGWSPRAVAGPPAPADVARGIVLWVAALAMTAGTWAIVRAIQPEIIHAASNNPLPAGGASATAVIIASLLNPVFEEFLWLGYAVPSLKPRLGLLGAGAVSVALRVGVHAYQGPWVLLGILPVSVLFTWYYGRTRRLWPVVVVHVILDVVGLAQHLGTPG